MTNTRHKSLRQISERDLPILVEINERALAVT
jgi:hypothetical protein